MPAQERARPERVVPYSGGTSSGAAGAGDDLNDDIADETLSASSCHKGQITRQGKMLIIVPMVWMLASGVAFAITWAASQPQRCFTHTICVNDMKDEKYEMHSAMVWALFAFLLHEMWNLVVSYRVAKPLVNFIDNAMDAFFPHLLVCIMLMVLLLENFNYSQGSKAYLVHAGGGGGPRGHKAVLTSTIVEWLINVPILITLAGHALGRSLRQCSFSVIVTNVYICLSWWAFFAVNDFLRFFLIFISFAMYMVASVDMFKWTIDFKKSRVYLADGRVVRQAMCIGLIVIFGIYGVIFLASMAGQITSYEERWAYTIMNVGTKFVYALTYATLRLISYHETIVDQIINRPTQWHRNNLHDHTSEAGNVFNGGELCKPLLTAATSELKD